jgi:radical SAM protein with 4Fe4S-binding SPASM domain
LRRVPCIRPWTQFVILQNGDVTVCCEDSDGKLVVGNINGSSMREIWWGEKLLAIRHAHLEGRQDAIPLCRQCSFYSVWW